MAPRADVIVTNAFAVAGSTLESDLMPRLTSALGQGVDIFHLTIAAPTREDLPLIAFEAWLKLLRQYKGVVVVVAAGNSGSQRPSWPAAFSEVVSVGALGADWRSRARFSNHGGWVDVYAPGRDLINAYTSGTYKCEWAPYDGQSGTSTGWRSRAARPFDAHRDRADRGADVPDRRKWPGSRGRAAGRGPGQRHPGGRPDPAALLRRPAPGLPAGVLLRSAPAPAGLLLSRYRLPG